MSRLEWILGLILVLLLVVAAGLALSLWLRPQMASPTGNDDDLIAAYADNVAELPETSGQTAKSAFILAQTTAQAWQQDTKLINASATWPQGAQANYIKQGTADWGFTFHSPSTQTNALVSIVNGQPVLIPGESKKPIDLLQSSSWHLDSSDAIKRFLEEGGETFINNEGITIVSMTFATNNPNENGRLEWLISALATQTGHSYTMRVDASTGETLEIINTSS
ncbi:MAG: hypothetical protein IAF02_24940 [Anaerolineae bacterium]|nr:hypothetical protein [Anaerolineae bacterium]